MVKFKRYIECNFDALTAVGESIEIITFIEEPLFPGYSLNANVYVTHTA